MIPQEQPHVLKCLIIGSDVQGGGKERRAVRQEIAHGLERAGATASHLGPGRAPALQGLSLDPRTWPNSHQVSRAQFMVPLSTLGG